MCVIKHQMTPMSALPFTPQVKMARYMEHFFPLPSNLLNLEDGNVNLSRLIWHSIKEVIGWDNPSSIISSAATSRQQSRLGFYDLVVCLEAEFCFQASRSYGGSIILFSMVLLSRYEQCIKQGGEEVDEEDGRREGGEHKGRKESSALVSKPLSIFDQFYLPRLIKTKSTTMLDEILSHCSDAV
jgi:hypothetical protein